MDWHCQANRLTGLAKRPKRGMGQGGVAFRGITKVCRGPAGALNRALQEGGMRKCFLEIWGPQEAKHGLVYWKGAWLVPKGSFAYSSPPTPPPYRLSIPAFASTTIPHHSHFLRVRSEGMGTVGHHHGSSPTHHPARLNWLCLATIA